MEEFNYVDYSGGHEKSSRAADLRPLGRRERERKRERGRERGRGRERERKRKRAQPSQVLALKCTT